MNFLDSSKFDQIKIKCEVDLEEHELKHVVKLDCNHNFCRECLKNYLVMKVKEKKVGENDMTCPTCHKQTLTYYIITDNLDDENDKKYH